MGRVAGAALSPVAAPTEKPCGPLHGCHMASVLPSVSRLADGGACRARSVTARTRVGPSARTATCAARRVRPAVRDACQCAQSGYDG